MRKPAFQTPSAVASLPAARSLAAARPSARDARTPAWLADVPVPARDRLTVRARRLLRAMD